MTTNTFPLIQSFVAALHLASQKKKSVAKKLYPNDFKNSQIKKPKNKLKYKIREKLSFGEIQFISFALLNFQSILIITSFFK